MKLKQFVTVMLLGAFIFACNDDSNTVDNHDPIAQEAKDDADLIEYMQTHYLNEEDNIIYTITDGETPLYDGVEVMEYEYKDINYSSSVGSREQVEPIAGTCGVRTARRRCGDHPRRAEHADAAVGGGDADLRQRGVARGRVGGGHLNRSPRSGAATGRP